MKRGRKLHQIRLGKLDRRYNNYFTYALQSAQIHRQARKYARAYRFPRSQFMRDLAAAFQPEPILPIIAGLILDQNPIMMLGQSGRPGVSWGLKDFFGNDLNPLIRRR